MMFRGPYNLNVVAWRNPDGKPDAWDDALVISFEDDNGHVITRVFREFTTDPGAYYATNPLNPEGTASLALGFHRGAYRIGLHRGQYPALVPTRPLPVYRDRDRDGKPDMNGPLSASQTVNLHHGSNMRAVGKASAGCQVLRHPSDLAEVLSLVKLQAVRGFGATVSYDLRLGVPS